MAHTPGPWAAGGNSEGAWLIQSDLDSFQAPWAYQKGTVAAVAPLENAKANAHLIAAAPDLLDACKQLTEFAKRQGWFHVAIEAGVAAIAKAEGRS